MDLGKSWGSGGRRASGQSPSARCALGIQRSETSLSQHLQRATNFAKLFLCLSLFYHGAQQGYSVNVG